jgi:hypothetical protein
MTRKPQPAPSAALPREVAEFSPVDNEPPLRWLRRLGLAPADGLGTVRRALFFVALTWLPLAVWAAWTGRLVDPESGESLARHYGIHVRCLLAVPLFILAEDALHFRIRRIAAQFLESGVVSAACRPGYERTLRDMRRVRDAAGPWVLMLAAVLAWVVIDPPSANRDALSWALLADGSLGFGGWWFAYVARPIFLALLLAWIWRIALVAWWFWRISRLDLSLVPTHPDRMGGLLFAQRVPEAYAMVTFAMSAVTVSRWAHEIDVHGAKLGEYLLPAAVFVVGWALLALLPLLVFARALTRARFHGLVAYGALVGTHVRLVHRRWILGETIGEAPILAAPEIGPVADANGMFEAVRNMRFVPIGPLALADVALPLVLPMLALATLQIPLRELLLTLARAVL